MHKHTQTTAAIHTDRIHMQIVEQKKKKHRASQSVMREMLSTRLKRLCEGLRARQAVYRKWNS